MKLRARWTGAPPRIGDYLMSPTRPRYAYRICALTSNHLVSWDPALKQEVRRLTITADRLPPSSVPKDARVHPWRWDKREPRHKRS